MLKKNKLLKDYRINKEINASKVRLMDVDGKQIGIVDLIEAFKLSQECDLDLVEISANANPPVCRIMDYKKFIYKKNKIIKEQKKKNKIMQVKEVKFRPVTEEEDYKNKMNNITNFLCSKNKVKVTVLFKGREVIYKQNIIKLLNRICNDLKKLAVVESFPKNIEGRQITIMLIPK